MDEESKVFVVTWVIENFLFCTQRNGKFLSSPGFKVKGIDNQNWHLRLYPRGSGKRIDEVDLYLCQENDTADISVEFELSFLHEDGRVDIITVKSESTFSNKFPLMGRDNFTNRSKVFRELGEYPSKSSFVVRCRFWIPDKGGPSGRCFLRTRIGIQRSACSWILDEFGDEDIGKKRGLPISFTSSKDLDVGLTYYITHGPRCDEKLNVDIELPPNNPHHFAWCRLTILGDTDNFKQSIEEEFWLKSPPNSTMCRFRPFRTAGKPQKGYFSKRNMRLLCDLVLSKGVVYECVEETHWYPDRLEKWFSSVKAKSKVKFQTLRQGATSLQPSTLESDLQFLRTENDLCDMKLKTHTSIFPAHSVILSARSPVFRAMFDADMKEKRTESVDIVDLEDDTVRSLLKFMYTDTVEELRMDSAKKLYFAADKYQVALLKKMCADFLVGNLTADNVCEILTLADMHQDEELKKSATDFVLCSYKTVFESEQWKTFMEENSRLAAEVMYIMWTKE